MKFSIIAAALAVSTAFCVPALGEEALKRYVYDDSGQYRLANTPNGQGGNRHSGFFQAAGALISIPEVNAEDTAWSLRGSHNYKVTSGFNVQFDGVYETFETETTSDDNLIAAAHLYYRDPQSYAAGGFVQVSEATSENDARTNDFIAGVEAAAFTDNFTVLGQAGLGQTSYQSGSNDHFVVKGGVRFYMNDNLRFDAEASFDQADLTTAEFNTTEVAFAANYRPSTQPVSVFAGYRYENASLDVTNLGSVDLDSHTWFAGARIHYGSATLKDEERNGALWSPAIGYFE